MSSVGLMGILILSLFALFTLVEHAISKQTSGLPQVAKVSRTLIDLGWSLGNSEAEDVKFIESGIASCELSLKAHSDRVLNGVKDVRQIMNMLVGDEEARVKLTRKISSASRKMVGECPSGPVRLSLHADIGEGRSLPSGVYFTMDLPMGSGLPVFQGDVGKACRVGRRGHSGRIFLSNVDIEAVGPQVGADGIFGEDLASMVLSIGAKDVIIDGQDHGIVDFYALISCENSSQVQQEYVFVTKNVQVGQAREILSDALHGTDLDVARSFMVAGLLGRYFEWGA